MVPHHWPFPIALLIQADQVVRLGLGPVLAREVLLVCIVVVLGNFCLDVEFLKGHGRIRRICSPPSPILDCPSRRLSPPLNHVCIDSGEEEVKVVKVVGKRDGKLEDAAKVRNLLLSD